VINTTGMLFSLQSLIDDSETQFTLSMWPTPPSRRPLQANTWTVTCLEITLAFATTTTIYSGL